MDNSAAQLWVKGKIQATCACADNWGKPNPGGFGTFFIYMSELPYVPNGYNRVVIRSDHPAYNAVVQSAIEAKVSDKTVALCYVESCETRGNSWDFGQLAIDIPPHI
ncbi:hypothetical protein [Bacillus pumilus]|uniref:hypothetical protein n=1 Tax=Bacillus pumilus TaxID=1408 RepID=UPI002493978E|nr:hypothetical protein [Bacillus pumilus]